MNVTDDRQTDDGWATAYSEREREFTFAKNQSAFDVVMCKTVVTCYFDSCCIE